MFAWLKTIIGGVEDNVTKALEKLERTGSGEIWRKGRWYISVIDDNMFRSGTAGETVNKVRICRYHGEGGPWTHHEESISSRLGIRKLVRAAIRRINELDGNDRRRHKVQAATCRAAQRERQRNLFQSQPPHIPPN